MKGSAVIGRTMLVLLILAAVAGWYFFQRTGSEESKLMKEAYTATAMKQEIVALKAHQIDANSSKRPGAEVVLQPEFEIALRAELMGDEQLTNKDYAAAIKSYSEALSNFKKALGEFETGSLSQTMPQVAPDQDNAKPTPLSKLASDPADEIKKLSQKALDRERQLLATAEPQMMIDQKKPAVFPAEPSAPKSTLNVEKNAGAITSAVDTQAANRQKIKEAKSNGEAKPEELSAAAPEIVSRETPDKKFASADTSNKPKSEPGRGAQTEAQEEETAKRAIANLLGAYQNSLAAKDLGGLKTLFQGTFSIQNEKAWSDFFAQATDLRASVEGKNYQLNDSRGESDLVITIFYSNHKGIRQKPLKYSERWTLERQNGNWSIVARRFE